MLTYLDGPNGCRLEYCLEDVTTIFISIFFSEFNSMMFFISQLKTRPTKKDRDLVTKYPCAGNCCHHRNICVEINTVRQLLTSGMIRFRLSSNSE